MLRGLRKFFHQGFQWNDQELCPQTWFFKGLMATEIWVNIGSGNGLSPDGTKPLPEPNVDWSSVKSSDIHPRAIPGFTVSPFPYLGQVNLGSSGITWQDTEWVGSKMPSKEVMGLRELSKIVHSSIKYTNYRFHLTHCGRVTHYGDGCMLCKIPIFFTMK